MAEEKTGNRRRGPDSVIKLINGFVIASWVVIIGILIMFTLAKPDVMTQPGVSKSINLDLYDPVYLRISFILMIIQLVLCVIGLVINVNRNRRKTDITNRWLLFFALIALAGIVIYIVLT